ncbi:MAG: ATP-binding protein [Oscillospiraceae bacterium]
MKDLLDRSDVGIWRTRLMRMNLIMVVAVFVIELGISIVILFQGSMAHEPVVYLERFLILPTIINCAAVLTEYILMKKYPEKNKLQNYLVVYTLTILCMVVASTHYVFSPTLLVFCFPLMCSIVFVDKKLTRSVTLISVVGIAIALINRYFDKGMDTRFIPEGAISVCITFLLSYTAELVISLIHAQRQQLIKLTQEARNAQEQAVAASRSKSSFLANMSHEIRTPINGVLGMDSMILRECTDPEIREYALNIQSAGRSLLSLINDILDFSKIESGKMEIIPANYELFSVINDCYNLLYMRAQESGLELRVENDPTVPVHLVGDEVRVRQIISNLLTNGVKYTKTGYVLLKINWSRIDDDRINLIVSVKDTGIGISKENMEKLFRSFQRIDEKHNRSIEGTGLGLKITKQLIELMGGSIDVQSEFGKGSEFTVTIPQEVTDTESMGLFADRYRRMDTNEVYREKFRAPEARILVVDDVPMNLKVFKGLLKNTQMQIDTAEGGARCLELVKKQRYDIIFLDHMMPDMDGIEVFRHMKALGEYINSKTPVIMLTANAIVSAKDEYMREGFDGYLSKPVRDTDLEWLILKHLPQSKIITDFGSEEPAEAAPAQTVAQTVEPPQDKSVMERLGEILSTETGMMYCMNDESFYLEIIAEYINSDRREKLTEFYDSNNINDYRVSVHALKSSSLSIGATQLSEAAKALEFAAKDNDLKFIAEHHQPMMEMYTKLLDELKAIVQ